MNTAIQEAIEEIEQIKLFRQKTMGDTETGAFIHVIQILKSKLPKEKEQMIEHGIKCYQTGYTHRDLGRNSISQQISERHFTQTYGDGK